MKILVSVFLLMTALHSPAQILKKIKDRAVDKAKENTVDRAKYEARSAYHQKMNDIRAEFDSTDFDYAVLVSDNAGLFNIKDRREMGGKFLNLKSIGTQLYRKDIDLSDEDKAVYCLHSGQSAYAMGRYLYAEKRFQAAQEYFEKGYLTSHPGYVKTISNEGLLFATIGRYAQAEEYTARALKMREDAMGAEDMEVAASLNNYAVLHYNLGRYNEAEKEFARALSVIEANKMQKSVQYAIVLNNEAMLFQALGRYDNAEKLMQQVIGIGEGLDQNVKTGNRLRFYSNLALLYQQMGKYNEAENIYLKMQKKISDRTTPEFANVLNNAAILYLVMNKQDKVEDMLQKSADIFKKSFGENAPAYAKVISDLGNFYRYKSRYAEAEPLLTKAEQVREASLGTDHPLTVQSQEDLAVYYWKAGQTDKAYPLYHTVMEKSLDFINRFFPPMSESEKSKYWDILSPRFQRFFNFALEASAAGNKNALTEMMEYRLATKGLLLSSTRKITRSIMASGNADLIKDYQEWTDQKEELAKLYAFSKEELQDQGLNLDSLQQAVNAREKRLSESSKDFSRFMFTAKVKPADVQAKLKPDEALVEIIRLRSFDQSFTDSSRYIALVLVKGQAQPGVVVMQNGYDMEKKLFKAYRKSMINKIQDEQSYNYFWLPAENLVKGKKKIFLSLDGVYNQVNLNTMKKPGGDYILNQYELVLIGNGKDLLDDNAAVTAGKKATLIGDPDYGNDKSVPPLPATKTEVDGINKVLKTSGYQVAEYVQKDATESNLKAAHEVSVLHIATHGFFYPDPERASWPVGVHADNARDNVLLRSGLMLSGASAAGEQNFSIDSTNNGVMTSYEAMNLDLKGTRLVVLSACETGLGEIKAGEGVYGLQRAFLVAGADAIIMSLWKVDDAATQQLMNNFYANWIKGPDKQKAFRQAQQQLMAKYKEPYYWGAFVMMEN